MKVGLVLSGGGIRGAVHIGVLKALEENNIKIDIIGGTSSGSLVASLYAMGYNATHIYHLFKRYAKLITEIERKPIIAGIGNFVRNKRIKINGVNQGKKIEEIYNEFAIKKNIKKMYDIKMPIVIPTIDIKDGKEYIFTNKIPYNQNKKKYITDINIGTAVRASSSFPAIFCPCEYKEHIFLDGGTIDNIPIKEVKIQGADKIITVNYESIKINKSSDIMDIALRTLDIIEKKIMEEDLKKSDIILNIPIKENVGFLDTNKIDNLYKYGYEYTIYKIKEIKNIMS